MRTLAIRIMLLLCLAAMTAGAQSLSPAPTADFGVIEESGGPVSMRVYLTNSDTIPLEILRVTPSCGCTAADYQQTSFLPGDSAWIELTYDPAMRPGVIDKFARVSLSNGNKIRVPVTGLVKASDSTVSRLFPVDGHLLHLSETTLISLQPLEDTLRAFYVDVYNSNDFPVWTAIENTNAALECEVDPNPIPPYHKSLVCLYLDPYDEPDRNRTEYTVNLYTSTTDSIEKVSPIAIKILFDNHGTP